MPPAPATVVRISTLLCVLLQAMGSSFKVITFFTGETVPLNCLDEAMPIGNLSEVTQIIWRKEEGSRSLHFVSAGKQNASNFTDSRISFLNPPLQLQIKNARTGDAGNYTCEITKILSGNFHKSWRLQLSDVAESTSSTIVYISSSIAAVVVILVLIAGIIYWKFFSKHNIIPSQIHQTSPENNEKEEPVYDNIHEDYFLRFNTLYDTMRPELLTQRPSSPQ